VFAARRATIPGICCLEPIKRTLTNFSGNPSIHRAQSVRRTSLRDKTLTTKKDAVEETRLRLQAQEATDSETPSSGGDPLTNGYGYGNNNGEKRPSTGSSNGQPLPHSKSADALDNATSASSAALSATTTTTHSYPSRRPPDGRENDELLRLKAAGGVGEVQRATSAAAVILSEKGTAASAEAVQIQSSKEAANGKINVQVTVLVGESTVISTCRARFRRCCFRNHSHWSGDRRPRRESPSPSPPGPAAADASPRRHPFWLSAFCPAN